MCIRDRLVDLELFAVSADAVLRNRLRVQPGITGMWQVGGRLDGDGDGDDYGQLDLYYVDNWTLVTDLTIILRTVPAVLLQKGSY